MHQTVLDGLTDAFYKELEEKVRDYASRYTKCPKDLGIISPGFPVSIVNIEADYEEQDTWSLNIILDIGGALFSASAWESSWDSTEMNIRKLTPVKLTEKTIQVYTKA